ncbi:D-alanine--D-alanine ligase [Thioalkalivibrio nitratireducens DSM 14787]|uniref:D-alanine--D-alanine ligase n=1 Tax=Thioalkalivibrio nitratireducens (strain DSM 14787 / UNIQEM 213 / ALEN2) TaxID=1255043 RepID=L0DZ11_THIND|nr:D-alanine--D-alanine ligase [Thioalkalivibrio nitratireducens]AGA34242.1 D-alanine--D-alanine ligase [Thioalkalivibrio nitratireducens DSM 14787]
MTQTAKRAARYGRVAVLMGGWSDEREISLGSGQAVLQALLRQGVDATPIDLTVERARSLDLLGYDRAFIALHGTGGEDGTIQGCLDIAGVPYTGSGVLGSALGMDKLACKRLWGGTNLPSAPYRLLSADSDPEAVADALGLPLIVKPSRGGSSLGLSRVQSTVELQAAYDEARRHPGAVFAEQWIVGREFTVAIVANEPLPVIQIETPGNFYDYHAKYEADTTRYRCPPPLDSAALIELQTLALSAFAAIDGDGWGRVDLLQDVHGENYLIEVNTVPGMTDHSLVPKAAAQAGIGFDELCLRILDTSFRAEGAD